MEAAVPDVPKREPVNKWPWQKHHAELLITNYRKMKIMEIAALIGCPRTVIYNKIAALGLSRRWDRIEKQKERVEKFLHTMSEMKMASEAVPWPRVETTMAAALRGRDFGGNTVAAGTKRPQTVRTDWTGGMGEAKSSLG